LAYFEYDDSGVEREVVESLAGLFRQLINFSANGFNAIENVDADLNCVFSGQSLIILDEVVVIALSLVYPFVKGGFQFNQGILLNWFFIREKLLVGVVGISLAFCICRHGFSLHLRNYNSN